MKGIISILKNKNISLGLCLALAIYITFMSERLPEVTDFIRSSIGRLIMCSVIVFISQHNLQLALMLALVFVTQVNNEGFLEPYASTQVIEPVNALDAISRPDSMPIEDGGTPLGPMTVSAPTAPTDDTADDTADTACDTTTLTWAEKLQAYFDAFGKTPGEGGQGAALS